MGTGCRTDRGCFTRTRSANESGGTRGSSQDVCSQDVDAETASAPAPSDPFVEAELRRPQRSNQSLVFYFDYASPFAYLASTQIQRIACAYDAVLTYKPIFLGGLFKALGAPLVPVHSFSEPKRRYALRDIQHWARYWGVPLKWPPSYPFNTLPALRLSLLADSPQLVHAIMHAVWAAGRLPSRETLRGCCQAAGIDQALLNHVDRPDVKLRLREATQEAVDRNVPGAPSFIVGDELFWGQDRLLFVEQVLAGESAAPRSSHGEQATLGAGTGAIAPPRA